MNVLVLNQNWQPVRVASARRALVMLYLGVARALDQHHRAFDFEQWLRQPLRAGDDALRSVKLTVRVPRIVVLRRYSRVPRGRVRLSRRNVFARDRNTCQYCGRELPRQQLNLDHVVPRARGGKTSWQNVVCCCIRCNHVKGSATPTQARMRLLSQPRMPRWSPLIGLGRQLLHRDWLPFLSATDLALLADG